jgi:methylated-DNA-[protein]-cysteine S-methyltransferase
MKTRQASGSEYHVTAFSSSLGWMAVRWCDGRVARLVFGHRGRQAALRAVGATESDAQELRPTMQDLVERLTSYAAGACDDFRDVEVDLNQNTPFQRAVLASCREIPHGTVLSYAQLADKAGSPRSARAVGNVMANNRIPLLIPCHRVVGSRGGLGGFSAPAGTKMKRRLLQMEGSWRIENDE